MHYLAWTELLSFYFSALGTDDQPAVVVREKRVLEANTSARVAGVHRGMGVSEAKAILERGVFHRFDPEPFREAQARWLGPLAEITDVIEPVDLHVAVCDLSALPRPDDLMEEVRRNWVAQGLSPRIGVASSRWLAQLASRTGDKVVEKAQTYLAPRPVHDLIPLPPETCRRLQFLGCRTVRDVAETPLETLQQQFGEAGLDIWNMAHGKGDPQVDALFPPESMAHRIAFESGIQDTDSLVLAIQELAQVLGLQLIERDRMGSTLEMWLELESGVVEKRVRTFARRMQSPGSLLPALALILRDPPEDPILAIRVRLGQLVPALRVQRTLEGRSAPEMREVAVARAVREVRATFGDQAVKTVSELPLPRRVHVLRAWKNATGWH